jgi:CRISPR-associated protein Cst1
MSPAIQFVGDPFVDTGAAVLEFRLDKPCADFSESDLAFQANELASLYRQKAWIGYLTVHFPNSCWCNATMGPDKKQRQQNALLRAFNWPDLAERECVYCRRPAQQIADRSTIPLLTGATTMTTGPGGEPGLPVCSACLFAVQFYPLATLKVNGRPLFWWTPRREGSLNQDWMFCLTSDFAKRVSQILEGSPDQVPSLNWPSTRLLESAEEVLLKARDLDLPLVDLLGCHMTNYGSGPDFEEIRLKRGILEFLRAAKQYSAYRTIRDSAWETVPAKPRKAATKPARNSPSGYRRNFFFEDIGKMQRRATIGRTAIIHRHFTPHAGREAGVFELACHFARKVLEMTQEQVKAIKELAGQIAASRQAENYLDRLFQRRGFTNYIRTLTEISDRMKRANEAPLATETILQAFDLTNEDDASPRDEGLVRELILIRLIEVLPQERLKELPQLESEEIQEQK